jgi:hypothetical protein
MKQLQLLKTLEIGQRFRADTSVGRVTAQVRRGTIVQLMPSSYKTSTSEEHYGPTHEWSGMIRVEVLEDAVPEAKEL